MTKPAYWLCLGLALIGCGADTEVGEPLRIVARDLPEAYLGEPYQGQVSFSGGVRPYQVSLEGQLPEGIRHSQGTFSGTPQAKGEFPLKLTVEDAGLSVRTEDLVLEVVDPPLPKLEAKIEGEDEPVLVLSLLERETPGFRARLNLGQAQIDPEQIELNERVFAVTSYDPDQGVLDIDGVLSQPGKGLEVLRVPVVPKPLEPAEKDNSALPPVSSTPLDPQVSTPPLDPQVSTPPLDPQGSDAPLDPQVSTPPLDPQGSDAPLDAPGSEAPQESPGSDQPTQSPDAEDAKPAPPFRPNIRVQAQFLRDRSQFFPGEVPARPQVEGEYDFGDLIVLASNWGAERPQEATPKNEQDGAPESEAALPASENGAGDDAALPASENGSSETLPASENGSSETLPASENGAGDDAALPASENGSSETLPASENGAGDDAALPASENGKGETSPASSPGSQTTLALPLIAGDLDRDGKVGEADLEKLRSSYSWQAGEIRGQPEPLPSQTPAAEPAQAPPAQDSAP